MPTRIRLETADDAGGIRRVNDLAFGRPDEGRLVDELRRHASPFISLVAVEEGEVVGHIAFSPVRIDTSLVLGLAPMSVLPERQKEGIGSALVREGLDACRRAGFLVIVVLGHPEYYPRFGFRPASLYNVTTEYDVPDEAFMLAELEPGSARRMRGIARYHAAFNR